MKPHNERLAPIVPMSPQCQALQQSLNHEKPGLPKTVLTALVACGEVVSLDGSPPPEAPADRSSLRDDVGAALAFLGPEVQVLAKSALADFKAHTLMRLPELLETSEGIRLAASASRTVVARLSTSDAAAAAWRDVRNAFLQNDDLEVGLARIAHLRSVLEHRGHLWRVESESLARLLNDSAVHAAAAGAQVEVPDGFRERHEARARLTETERFDFAERLVRAPGGSEVFVVYMIFRDAALEAGELEVGRVRLIDVGCLRHEFEGGGSLTRFGFPDDRRDAQFLLEILLDMVPADAQVVIGRVESSARRGDVIKTARGTLTGIVDVATLPFERQIGWHLADGYALVAPDGRLSCRSDPEHAPKRLGGLMDRFRFHPERRLKELDVGLLSAWHEGRDDAINAIELARWHAALRDLPDDRFRVALGIRNLERTLPRARFAGASWTRAVAFYLKELWCWTELLAEIDDIRHHVISAPLPHDGTEPARSVSPFYENLRATIGVDTITREMASKLPTTVAELMPEGSSRWRLLTRFGRDTASATATDKWLGRKHQEFDRLLARAARQRNAVIHGSRTSPPVVENVVGFVQDLNSMVVQMAVDAAASGLPLERHLEEMRVEAIEREARVESGADLKAVLTSEGAPTG